MVKNEEQKKSPEAFCSPRLFHFHQVMGFGFTVDIESKSLILQAGGILLIRFQICTDPFFLVFREYIS